ncbi:MAG TPA: rhomboid family intramembrane serine protease [Candidatus Limnocylindrales bacterium]|jgi:GlpG protein|nr:rhomboid family intramembrane serine protease [Candidatus Limnocylindrales bacterium]
MRLIGHLATESTARTFGDYLYVQGIENRIEQQQEDGWAIWVNDEDKLEGAAQLLEDFRTNPSDPKYQTQAKGAAALRAEEEKSQEAYRKRLRERRHLFRPLSGYGFGPLTFALIVISAIVFFLSRFGYEPQRVMALAITSYSLDDAATAPWDNSLPEIRHGEIWRLITPIFIHFHVLHILFNMLWLRDLGSMIEGRQSSTYLLLLVLVIAAGSNLAQFYFGHSPGFGGMSGVVYGLLGYIWLRGKFDPASGLFLHPSTVTMMLIWLVACYTGILGSIANTAHLVGLLMGVAWGYLSSLRYR